jgi:hypothetical protein
MEYPTNEFYSISKLNTEPNNQYQLRCLGFEKVDIIIGSLIRGDFGEREYRSKPSLSKVKSEDYDKHFAVKIININPPYEVENLFNYHLNHYIDKGGARNKFLLHIRYVVLEHLKIKYSKKTAHIELTERWLQEQENKTNSKSNMSTTITGNNNFVTIATGDISQNAITINISNDQYDELRDLGVEERHLDALKEIVSNKVEDKQTLKTRLSKLLSAITVSVVTRGITEGLPRLQEIGAQLLNNFQ